MSANAAIPGGVPARPGSTLATIGIHEGAVATSGRDQRRFYPKSVAT